MADEKSSTLPTTPSDEIHATLSTVFLTQDLDRLHDTIARKGVQTTSTTQQYFGSIFTVDAPDGHLVTVVRRSRAQ